MRTLPLRLQHSCNRPEEHKTGKRLRPLNRGNSLVWGFLFFPCQVLMCENRISGENCAAELSDKNYQKDRTC